MNKIPNWKMAKKPRLFSMLNLVAGLIHLFLWFVVSPLLLIISVAAHWMIHRSKKNFYVSEQAEFHKDLTDVVDYESSNRFSEKYGIKKIKRKKNKN
jgi:hypothetical protein|tara:strand:+ start:816 stop:1106 length:291 start_codon:yes stop_codon:yes gene_type:complete